MKLYSKGLAIFTKTKNQNPDQRYINIQTICSVWFIPIPLYIAPNQSINQHIIKSN